MVDTNEPGAPGALDKLRGEQLLPVPQAIRGAQVPLTKETAYRHCRQGQILSVRVGAKVYTTSEEILRFVARCSARAVDTSKAAATERTDG